MTLLRPQIPQALCLFLLLLITGQVVSGFIFLFSIDQAKPVSQNQLLGPLIPTKKEGLAWVKVAFFGDYVPSDLSESGVKQSLLDLKVVGILFSKNEKSSQVIIQIAPGQEQFFKEGDRLPMGVEIKRITQDGVLISRHGLLESLRLPKKKLIMMPRSKPL